MKQIDTARIKAWDWLRCHDCREGAKPEHCPVPKLSNVIWRDNRWQYVRKLCKRHEKQEGGKEQDG